MTIRRYRRIIRRAKIEAIVDAQRQARVCFGCSKLCYSRLPYSIDGMVDDVMPGEFDCSGPEFAPTVH